jgi:hypothetical protein
MALGGGTFTTQNKTLPGSYINVVSAVSRADEAEERGYAALPMLLSWGPVGQVFKVTKQDFSEKCKSVFGFDYFSDEAKGLRDLFQNIHTLYCYRVNSKNAKQAENTNAIAKYAGSVGNSIKTEILEGVIEGTFDISIYIDTKKVYEVNVKSITELKNSANDWVIWKDAELTATAVGGVPLTGGADGDTATVSDYSVALDAFQSYKFNAIGCLSDDEDIKALFVTEVKDMRENRGIKYQTVLHRYEKADYEGVVSVDNNDNTDLVYYTLGLIAGCDISESNTNRVYSGEFEVDTLYSQAELENAIKDGKFVYHQCGDSVRVLSDINTLVSFTESKNKDFAKNQTVRTIDQFVMDVSDIFNTKYIGKIPNDEDGRTSLWNDIVSLAGDYQTRRAITDFESENITVTKGDNKNSIVANILLTVVGATEQLYMSVVVG